MGDRATRAAAPALLVLALVAFVAIASTGSRPGGTDETRGPSELLLDVFFTFALVAFIPAAAILIWGLMQRREIAEALASGRFGRRRGLATFLLVVALLGAFGYWRLRDPRVRDSEQLEDILIPRGAPQPGVGEEEAQYEAEFAWIPLLVVLVLAGLGLAAYHASVRRRRQAADSETMALAVAEVLDDTLDDLRAERDPRKAVIAAYARLERTLAAHGSARKAAETPEEFLARILPRLAIERGSIRRLTDLFTRAKFSQHDVDAGMKDEAIDALVQVRDELQAAAVEDAPASPPLRPTEGRA